MDLTIWKIMAWMTPRAKAAMDTGTASAPTSKPLTDDHRGASCMVDSTREAGRDGTLRRAGSVNRANDRGQDPSPSEPRRQPFAGAVQAAPERGLAHAQPPRRQVVAQSLQTAEDQRSTERLG